MYGKNKKFDAQEVQCDWLSEYFIVSYKEKRASRGIFFEQISQERRFAVKWEIAFSFFHINVSKVSPDYCDSGFGDKCIGKSVAILLLFPEDRDTHEFFCRRPSK